MQYRVTRYVDHIYTRDIEADSQEEAQENSEFIEWNESDLDEVFENCVIIDLIEKEKNNITGKYRYNVGYLKEVYEMMEKRLENIGRGEIMHFFRKDWENDERTFDNYNLFSGNDKEELIMMLCPDNDEFETALRELFRKYNANEEL